MKHNICKHHDRFEKRGHQELEATNQADSWHPRYVIELKAPPFYQRGDGQRGGQVFQQTRMDRKAEDADVPTQASPENTL